MDSGFVIWILAPVYNEAEGIKDFIENTSNFLDEKYQFQFILIDDGSQDDTYNIAKKALTGNSIIIKLEKNVGPGKAFEIGIKHFLHHASEKDYLLTLEGDNTADLETIPQMLKEMNRADLVLASVYLKGGGFRQTSIWRMILSRMANQISRLLLNLPFNTLTSFYRLWNFQILKKLNEAYSPLVEAKGFICQVELLYKAKVSGAQITEVPTRVLSDQRKGVSKMKLLNTAFEHLKFIFASNKFN